MRRRTKIVCTLGPAVASRESIKKLIDAGMNVARINCSHGDWPTRRQWIDWVRELSPEIAPVGILVDLQGPKFRIGELNGGEISLVAGETVTLGPGKSVQIPVKQAEMVAALSPGSRVLLGDGEIELKIGKAQGEDFEAKVVFGGLLKSRKGMTLVGKVFECPALTEVDKRDAIEACKIGVDFLALSYVHRGSDLDELRALVSQHQNDVRLCAKIETGQALKNLDDILQKADMAMIARGDLGLQIDFEEIPIAQKRIIRRCNELGKPAITATQMLESMIHAPRPTRAEVTDVANAILDGTDAVMLSAETATGEYSIESVLTMARIAHETEPLYDHQSVMQKAIARHSKGMPSTEAIAFSVVSLADHTAPAAIVTTTTSGQTACLVSKFRPPTPVLCATWKPRTLTQMSVVWGVEAILTSRPDSTDENVRHAVEAFVRHKRIKSGETVLVTAGVPAGTPGNTNLILSHVVE